jgi:hypothetical protein
MAVPGHVYWFAKHSLGWGEAALRHPEQAARWTWLILAAITQMRVVYAIALDRLAPRNP